MKKTLSVVVLAASVLAMAALAIADAGPQGRDGSNGRTQRGGPGGLIPVNITYDAGGTEDFFQGLSGSLDVFGNIFNSANGGPLQAGTITGVSWFGRDGSGGGDMTLSFIGPPAGGSAVLYTYINFTGVANSVFNAATISQPVGTSFLVGFYVGTFNGPDSVGMQNQTANGQGFHGFQGDFLGGATIGSIAPLPQTNAMIRAAGDLATIPVELTAFDVE